MKKLILAVMTLAPTVAMAVPGYYVQGQFGSRIIAVGAGLNAGYLWGDKRFNYGAQIGVQESTGIFDWNALEFDSLGVVQYTFRSGFLTFAKAGIAYIQDPVDEGTPCDPNYGYAGKAVLGIGYQITPKWEVDLDGEYADGRYVANGGLFTGLTYHFA